MLRRLLLTLALACTSWHAYAAAPVTASIPCELDVPDSVHSAANAAKPHKTRHIKLKLPQCYAHELAILTSAYLNALEKQVSSQQIMYSALATSYVSANRQSTGLGLDVARDAQVQQWIGHLADGSMTPNSVIEDASRLAMSEFSVTRSEEQQALDGKSAYLISLANLSSDTAGIAGLVTLFDALAAPSSVKQSMGDFASFGEATDAQMKSASCALATSRLTYFKAESASLAAKVAKTGISDSQKTEYAAQQLTVDQQITVLQKQASSCATPAN